MTVIMVGPAAPRCEHNRTAQLCEDCAHADAIERGSPVGIPMLSFEPVPDPEIAAEDVLIEREPGIATFIATGDPIPASLAALPRVPMGAPRKGKRGGVA